MSEDIVRAVKEEYAWNLSYLQSINKLPTYGEIVDDVARLTLRKIQDKKIKPNQKMQNISNLSDIELLVLDFDGVLTDNKVFVNEEGVEMVMCSRADSLGLSMLRSRRPDIGVIVLSKETNKVVAARCKKLQIECIQREDYKLTALNKLLKARNIEPKNIAYIGNDVNDVECLKAAGIGVAVADSVYEVIMAADYITSNKGGDGAVREFIELLLNKQHFRSEAG